MNTLEVLTQVREILSNSERWTQTWNAACDNQNSPVGPRSKNASKWTIVGALEKVQDMNTFHGDAYDTLDALCIKRGFSQGNVCQFNDQATHEDILALFSEAVVQALNDQNK